MSIAADLIRGHTDAIILGHLLCKESYGFKVVGYDGDTLRVSERTTATDTDMQLHWRYKNETLYIQPCASKWFLSVISWEKKNVTVEIPHAMLSSFTSIEVESADAAVEISDVTTDALKVETVGGFDCDYPIDKRGTLHICGDGKGDFDADTVSGDFYIKQP